MTYLFDTGQNFIKVNPEIAAPEFVEVLALNKEEAIELYKVLSAQFINPNHEKVHNMMRELREWIGND